MCHTAEWNKSSGILINNIGYHHFDRKLGNKRFQKLWKISRAINVDLKGTFIVLHAASVNRVATEGFTSATHNMIATSIGKVLP